MYRVCWVVSGVVDRLDTIIHYLIIGIHMLVSGLSELCDILGLFRVSMNFCNGSRPTLHHIKFMYM